MKEKKGKSRYQMWLKALVLMPFVLLFALSAPMDTGAMETEGKYYDKYTNNEYIRFKGEYILKNKMVYQTVFKGSKGGTMTFNPETDTIIFDHFEDEHIAEEDWFASYLGMAIGKNITIELKGDNYITTTNTKTSGLSVGHNTVIKGPGTLHMNFGISGGEPVEIRDCSIQIKSDRFALDVTKGISVYNADLDLSTTAMSDYQNAIRTSSLTVENVTIQSRTMKGYDRNIWLKAERADGTLIEDVNEVFIRKSGEIMVDENNNPLYAVHRVFNTYPYFWFTANVEEWKKDEVTYTARDIRILTPSRVEKLKEVESLIKQIEAIGTVTKDSGATIRAAREAYDSLGNSMQYKVTNSNVLEQAEKDYETINQEAAEAVNQLINQLGTITTESGAIISAAETAYADLTEDQKKYVTNPGAIETAKVSYQKALEEEKKAEEARKAEEAKKAEEAQKEQKSQK